MGAGRSAGRCSGGCCLPRQQRRPAAASLPRRALNHRRFSANQLLGRALEYVASQLPLTWSELDAVTLAAPLNERVAALMVRCAALGLPLGIASVPCMQQPQSHAKTPATPHAGRRALARLAAHVGARAARPAGAGGSDGEQGRLCSAGQGMPLAGCCGRPHPALHASSPRMHLPPSPPPIACRRCGSRRGRSCTLPSSGGCLLTAPRAAARRCWRR